MPSVRIQQRISPVLKRQAEAILEAQGIKPSLAIVMFYTEVKRSGGLPFTPSRVLPSEIPNMRLQKDLKEAGRGKGVRSFKNKNDLFRALHTA